MKSSTNSQRGTGGGDEKLVISLKTNQASHEDLIGVKFSVVINGNATEYTWRGASMTIPVTPMLNYSVEFGEVEGYAKPESVTHTAVAGNDRFVTGTYNTELVTVNVSAEEGEVSGYVIQVCEKKKIDTEYKYLDYIESTGYQYINTAYIPSSDNVRVVVDFLYTGTPSAKAVFGCQHNSETSRYGLICYNSPASIYVGSSAALLPKTISLNTRYMLDVSANNGTLNVSWNGLNTSTSYNGTIHKGYSFYLFGNNRENRVNQMSSIKMYSCKIYDNGVLVRDFVPSLNSSGVAGMYDKVGKIFYSSSSGTNFIAGKLTNTYHELEYIKSTGAQYIDTFVTAKSGLRTVLDCSVDDLSSTSNIFGAYSNSNRVYIHYDSSEKLLLGYGAYNKVSYNLQAGTRYVFDAEFIKGKQSLSIDGSKVYSGTDSTELTTNCSAYLCAMNSSSPSLYSKMTIYSCKIYDNGELVRDYIPAQKESGEIGLYDKVNNMFVQSATSTGFTAGGVKGTITNPNTGTINEYEVNVLYTQTTPSAIYKIPHETICIIDASEVSGYITPHKQVFTSLSTYRTIDIIYKNKPTGVYIVDFAGGLVDVDSWGNNSDATGVYVSDGIHSLIVAPDEWRTSDGTDYAEEWNGNKRSAWGGYNKNVTGIKTTTSNSDAITDFAGSANTDAIVSQLKGTTDNYSQYYTGAPAAEYCRAYSNGCKGVGQWYLPSAGEMNLLINNITAINKAMVKISGKGLGYYSYLWTSTQYDSSGSWGYYHQYDGWKFIMIPKYDYFGAHPICIF